MKISKEDDVATLADMIILFTKQKWFFLKSFLCFFIVIAVMIFFFSFVFPPKKVFSILVRPAHWVSSQGVIQPIEEIGKICKSQGIIFHVDAAQSVGKIPVHVNEMGIDLLSISAHKLYGPKGVGTLFIRRKNPQVQLQPIIFGGGHERGLRSGTLPVHNIIGFGNNSKETLSKKEIITEWEKTNTLDC